MERLLSTPELAELLGLAEVTVRKWVVRGDIPYLKLGRRILYEPISIKCWLRGHRSAAYKALDGEYGREAGQ